MDIREIANPATSLAGTSARRSKSSGIASEYSQILASKIANVKTDIEKMNATQEKLDEMVKSKSTKIRATPIALTQTVRQLPKPSRQSSVSCRTVRF